MTQRQLEKLIFQLIPKFYRSQKKSTNSTLSSLPPLDLKILTRSKNLFSKLFGYNAFLLIFSIGCLYTMPLLGFKHRNKIPAYGSKRAFFHMLNEKKFPEWMLTQIGKDLSPFQERGLSEETIDAAVKAYLDSDFGKRNSFELAKCEIREGVISIEEIHPTENTAIRLSIVLNALQQISALSSLPSVSFIICIGDQLCAEAISFFQDYGVPIFAFAKPTQGDPISFLIPDSEALKDGFYEKTLSDAKIAEINFPWKTKKEIVFWRGATTGYDSNGSYLLNLHNYREFPRVELVHLSANHPELIDAKLTILAQIEDSTLYSVLSPYTGGNVSVVDHLRYKYQILVDGNTCAYSRAYWQLFSGSVMFKQTSPNIQWYYPYLKPYVHYIPIAYDLNDLISKIDWAKNHDQEVKQIAENAEAFAKEHLQKEHVYLYLYLAMQKYAELF